MFSSFFKQGGFIVPSFRRSGPFCSRRRPPVEGATAFIPRAPPGSSVPFCGSTVMHEALSPSAALTATSKGKGTRPVLVKVMLSSQLVGSMNLTVFQRGPGSFHVSLGEGTYFIFTWGWGPLQK